MHILFHDYFHDLKYMIIVDYSNLIVDFNDYGGLKHIGMGILVDLINRNSGKGFFWDYDPHKLVIEW